jgi:hypothetical protein
MSNETIKNQRPYFSELVAKDEERGWGSLADNVRSRDILILRFNHFIAG